MNDQLERVLRVNAGKRLLSLVLLNAVLTLAANSQSIGWFDGHGDVGDVEIPGSATYDPLSQEYTVVGSGTNMWYDEDEFQFVWKRITGDFIVRAHAHFEGEGVNEHRKLGWIARSGLEPDSPYVDAAVHGDGLTSLQYRREKGAGTEEVQSTLRAPDVIQLERTGDRYIMSVARFGEPFLRWELSDIDLGDELYV
ncbi:MAG TPA: hypothetical protein VMO47_05960, partial [Rhodothermales bacterium]|nr:hypothetical protein [Rhodothermales bacterium]